MGLVVPNPRERRALEEAVARALKAGINIGQQRTFERVLKSTVSEVLGLEVRDTLDFIEQVGVKSALPLITEAAATAWPARYRERLTPVLAAIAESVTEGRAPLPAFDVRNPRMAEWLDSYTSELSGTLSGTSYANFERVLREAQENGFGVSQTSRLLRDRLPEINANRAALISRTELIRSSNHASLLQARESGVVKSKVWVTAGDNRVRPEHRALNGTEVGIDETFPNGLQAPGEPRCRCTLTYALDMDALRRRIA